MPAKCLTPPHPTLQRARRTCPTHHLHDLHQVVRALVSVLVQLAGLDRVRHLLSPEHAVYADHNLARPLCHPPANVCVCVCECVQMRGEGPWPLQPSTLPLTHKHTHTQSHTQQQWLQRPLAAWCVEWASKDLRVMLLTTSCMATSHPVSHRSSPKNHKRASAHHTHVYTIAAAPT